MGRSVGGFFPPHILGGMYDPHNYLEGQLPTISTIKNYLLLLQAGSVASPVEMGEMATALVGTGPREAGRVSCWLSMSRSLAASRKSINLPGPRIHESGNKMVTSK